MSKPHLKIVKIGGNVINNPEVLKAFLEMFATIPGNKILVHGGGREATKLAETMGIATQMIDGRRVTDKATLEVVTMVYAGLINKRIVARLQSVGCNSLGLTGADGAALCSVRRPAEPVDYGYVGDVSADSVNISLFTKLLAGKVTPVMCAITCDAFGQLLNTNADSVATALACGLAADFDVDLIFCFEMPGVLEDIDRPDSVIPVITRAGFDELLSSGKVKDGMIPKLTGALNAVDAGVSNVIITRHDLLATPDAGTKITADD